MQNRLAIMLCVSLLSFFTTPTLAATFYCPAVTPLPATLGLHGENPATHQIRQLQSFLTNLSDIAAAYNTAPSKGHRNQVANCMLDHLATLPDNHSLQAPATRADASTWLLVKDEAQAALATIAPSLRHKPELFAINKWLLNAPSQAVATR